MTAFVSIAKPYSQRTARGLILSGAQGKRARHDGRHVEYPTEHTRRPDLDIDTAIGDSAESSTYGWSSLPRPRRSNPSIWTSESAGFACPRSRRRRIRNVARAAKKAQPAKAVISESSELPEFDEVGRPIVYKTDDAWAHRCR